MSRRRTRNAAGSRRAEAAATARVAYAAAESGDLRAAASHFREALAAAPRDAPLLHDLAEVLALAGEAGEAIERLSQAMAVDEGQRVSAERLSVLLKRQQPVDLSGVERKGLEAALGHTGIDHQPIVRTGFALLKQQPPLTEALDRGRRDGWDEAARWLMSGRGKLALGDGLLLACLARGFNSDVELELLLTAIRQRLLCNVEAVELGRKPMPAFVCALIRQCANNEYVFLVTPEERQRIGNIAGQWRQKPGTTGDGIQDLMLLALYGPVTGHLAKNRDVVDVARLRPKAFRDIVTEALAAEDEERRLMPTIARLGTIAGDVTRRVAAQYEANPYPRWMSTAVPAPASKRDHLKRFVDESSLTFFDRPFDVLIAGCGTGQHAIQAAFGYGPRARLLATDLSLASLAYGARMAGVLGAGNIRYLQADILDMADMDQDFDVIECVGVLHHMADPAHGWRRLAERLCPGGLMRLGLYSELGRRDIACFRDARAGITEPENDDTIRRVRREIIDGDRGGGTWGEGLAGRVDFFTTSACRDLLFHTQERRLTISEIGGQLATLGLEFRGFDIAAHVADRFRERFPQDDAWLDLCRWETYEREQPSTFRGMYRFWCRKMPAGV